MIVVTIHVVVGTRSNLTSSSLEETYSALFNIPQSQVKVQVTLINSTAAGMYTLLCLVFLHLPGNMYDIVITTKVTEADLASSSQAISFTLDYACS